MRLSFYHETVDNIPTFLDTTVSSMQLEALITLPTASSADIAALFNRSIRYETPSSTGNDGQFAVFSKDDLQRGLLRSLMGSQAFIAVLHWAICECSLPVRLSVPSLAKRERVRLIRSGLTALERKKTIELDVLARSPG